jgi:hypothetical protein
MLVHGKGYIDGVRKGDRDMGTRYWSVRVVLNSIEKVEVFRNFDEASSRFWMQVHSHFPCWTVILKCEGCVAQNSECRREKGRMTK